MLILLTFHLILTSGPILLAKNQQKVVIGLWMLSKAGLRCVRIYAKNIGDPYYEPTIMVHDIMNPLSWFMIIMNSKNINKMANFSFL